MSRIYCLITIRHWPFVVISPEFLNAFNQNWIEIEQKIYHTSSKNFKMSTLKCTRKKHKSRQNRKET